MKNKALKRKDRIRTKTYQIYLSRLRNGDLSSGDSESDWLLAEHYINTNFFYKPWEFISDTTNRESLKIIISALSLGSVLAAAIGIAFNYFQARERLVTERFAKARRFPGNKLPFILVELGCPIWAKEDSAPISFRPLPSPFGLEKCLCHKSSLTALQSGVVLSMSY
jgi:hypothetical protein